MARMSLSQAAQSVSGKQPVQPVSLVGNPYGLSPALAPQVAAGESFLRNNMSAVPARRMSPPSPTAGSNAYRIAAPAGTFYNPNGQRDGRAIGVQTGFGAYPVINTRNPTMVVLPPRLDLFSHMQNDYANFYRNMLPFIMQMSQRAMQQGAKAARPVGRGNGSATKPKERPVEDLGSWNAYVPGVDMRGDRDSFTLRQPGVRPDYKISMPPNVRQWWQTPEGAEQPTASRPTDIPAERQNPIDIPAPRPEGVPARDIYRGANTSFDRGRYLEGAYSGPYAAERVNNNPYTSPSPTPRFIDIAGVIRDWWNRAAATRGYQVDRPNGTIR